MQRPRLQDAADSAFTAFEVAARVAQRAALAESTPPQAFEAAVAAREAASHTAAAALLASGETLAAILAASASADVASPPLDAAVRNSVQHRQLLMEAMPGSAAAVALTAAAGKLLPP